MNQTIQEDMKYLPWASSLCPNLRVFFILSSKVIIANCIQTKSCNHIPPVSLDSRVDLGFVGISAGCLQTDRFCRTERRHQEQMSRPCHHQWPCKLPKMQSTVDNTFSIGSGSLEKSLVSLVCFMRSLEKLQDLASFTAGMSAFVNQFVDSSS